MDFNSHKLLKRHDHKIGEAEDRISELPDSLLHHILSFLEPKCVAQTCILSKRWNDIWKSIPTLAFSYWDSPKPLLSLPEVSKFINFVDRTLLLHYASSIQKFCLITHKDMNASQVHSWISTIASRNVEELTLHLLLNEPFFVPMSLFTCESLTTLELSACSTIHLPKSSSFPKLKSLELSGIRFTGSLFFPKLKSLTLNDIEFTDDDCWDKQQFSNCPVLEKLVLKYCTWVGMRKFCISTPALKELQIANRSLEGNGLQDCDLKICAPSLVSITYSGSLAKDYDLSSFVTLDKAEVYFTYSDARNEQRIGCGAAVNKFFRALSYVQKLTMNAETLQALLDADDFVNGLPTFHKLNDLELAFGPVTDRLIFALLKAAPNLKRLGFDYELFDDDDDSANNEIVYDESEELFRHLQSVWFREFCGEGRELRWAKFILKNAKSLQTMTFGYDYHLKTREVLMSELSSLPKASERCVLKFV